MAAPPRPNTDIDKTPTEAEDFDADDSINSTYYDKNGNSYSSFNIKGLLFWNYYVTYISLFLHLCIHAFSLGMWCSGSKLVILYSVQVFCLHAYSWAIPDRRYAQWVKDNRNWFYFLSTLNIAFYSCGLVGGMYLYLQSSDGVLQFTGVSCMAYTLLSQSMMMLMFAVNHTTLSTRFEYERNPYHGRQVYPPVTVVDNSQPQNE